ncbi:unnamed protein product [Ilex paraguariensis]|uniref:Uncharacterized protein n=1 Tax=Ilex paraguariensis TaxID=185542 RepID=A0ABC8U605_9AQUA
MVSVVVVEALRTHDNMVPQLDLHSMAHNISHLDMQIPVQAKKVEVLLVAGQGFLVGQVWDYFRLLRGLFRRVDSYYNWFGFSGSLDFPVGFAISIGCSNVLGVCSGSLGFFRWCGLWWR